MNPPALHLLRTHGLDRIDHGIGERIREDGAEPQRDGGHHPDRGPTPRPAPRRVETSQCDQRTRGEHASGRRNRQHQGNRGGAAHPRPDQVCTVEAMDRLGPMGEYDGDQEPDRQEGSEEREAHQRQASDLRKARRRLEGAQLHRDNHEVPESDRRAAQPADPREQPLRRPLPQPPGYGDERSTGADSEQRESDDQIGVIGRDLERQHPRVADLEQQTGKRSQEDLEGEGLRPHDGIRCGWRHPRGG